jgi:hypothetical protein
MGEQVRVGILAALMLALSAVVPAHAAEAQVWAFLFADRPSEQGTYAPLNQTASRPGVSARVTRAAVGSYQVNIAGAGGQGVPVVTAVAGTGVHCQLTSFRADGTTERIVVGCYAGTTPTDSQFTLTYFSSVPPDSGAAGAYGYVHDNRPTLATYTNPPSYNSTGGRTEIYHNQDSWTVRFFGAAFNTVAGNVQVAALGAAPARCSIIQWQPHAQGMDARVRCHTLTDPTVRPQWTLIFAHDRSVVGGSSGFFGYLQATEPTSPDYTPNPDRNRAQDGFIHTVGRPGRGRYEVRVHGPLKAPVTLHVSVNGDTDGFCNIASWTIDPSVQPAGRVNVNCYDGNRALADRWFAINYYSP